MKCKTIMSLAVAALALLSTYAAEVIYGEFNTSLGYLAGQRASGNRVTAMGAGAGGESYGNEFTDFFGGASGAFSSRLIHTVGIGYRSLRYASDMSNVVAIGSCALAEYTGLRDATYLNGQFYAEKDYGLYLTHDQSMKKNNAPMFYTNGVWTLNGDLVVNGQISVSSPENSVVVEIPQGYDFYLDGNNGDDANSGMYGSPKRTMAGVYEEAVRTWTETNREAYVCVSPGVYNYITNISLTSGFYFKAIGGPDRTLVIPKVVTVSPDWWGERTVTNGFCNCGSDLWTVFEGFTFRGFSAGGTESRSPGSFNYLWFNDCRFEDAEPRLTRYAPVFYGCVLENCRVKNSVTPWTASSFGGTWVVYNNILLGCDCFDSIFDFGTRAQDSKDQAPRIAHQCYLENCYVSMPRCHGVITRPYSSYTTVLGSIPNAIELTVRVGQTNENGFKDVIGDADVLMTVTNSLIAIMSEDTPDVYGSSNKAVTYDGLNLDENFQPIEVGYSFWGFRSKENRGLRNSIVDEVAKVLDAHSLQSVARSVRSRMIGQYASMKPQFSPGARHDSVIPTPYPDPEPPEPGPEPEPEPDYPNPPRSVSAVVVGMRHSLSAGDCLGCDVDLQNVSELLMTNYSDIAITSLLSEQATWGAVSNALSEAVKSDLCIFYYSGHGGSSRLKIPAPEEVDEKDEYICLYDREMIDDQIWSIISKSQGRVFLIFDACHSETMFRSPGVTMARAIEKGRSSLLSARSVPTFSMLCWSGCEDDKLSYATENGGWLTNTILKHFVKGMTYESLWGLVSTDSALLANEIPKFTVGGNGFTDRIVFR